MNRARFSLNAFILIVILCAATLFFFTIRLTGMSHRFAINEYYPVEDSEFSVRYSTQKANGIYEGPEYADELRVEGDFGHDWGAAYSNGFIYTNEYHTSDLGLMFSDLVRIDANSFEKTVISENTVLRGRCASGELVCTSGSFVESVFAETNPLAGLYAMTDKSMDSSGHFYNVLYIDPASGDIVYVRAANRVSEEDFAKKYLDKTLPEVMK